MKKILMLITTIMLLVISYMLIFKNLTIGNYKSQNFKDIQNLSNSLDNKIQEANETINQQYAFNIEKITTSIKNLKTVKTTYDSKIKSLTEKFNVGGSQIEKYKIEFLWTEIGGYARDERLLLTIEPKQGTSAETYDLYFTVVGEYKEITDFLYDIENDDNLNFKPRKISIEPELKSETNSSGKTTTYATAKLKATFVVEDIVILK